MWHRASMRVAAALLIALVLAAPAGAATLDRYWSVTRVMRAVDGVRIRVGTHAIRIHNDTTLCSGEGRSIRRGGVRRWSRFVCTFTTFTKAGIDRDLEFQVYVTGPKRFAIRDAHWISGVR
jgi:hypothetical protein